uniref:Uncharacterized protein n=1 Tax=Arundo donax TaxID=35708 RepID=A0A0A9CNE2_ARUDO
MINWLFKVLLLWGDDFDKLVQQQHSEVLALVLVSSCFGFYLLYMKNVHAYHLVNMSSLFIIMSPKFVYLNAQSNSRIPIVR